MLEDRGARVEETSFGAAVGIVFSAPEGQFDAVTDALREFTAGDARVIPGETVFRPTEL